MDTTTSRPMALGPRHRAIRRGLGLAARVALALMALALAALSPASAAAAPAAPASFERAIDEAEIGQGDWLIDVEAFDIDGNGAEIHRPGAAPSPGAFAVMADLTPLAAGAPRDRPPRARA